MQTSGHGNDALMIVVPVGVALIVGVLLCGGPAEAGQMSWHVKSPSWVESYGPVVAEGIR